MSDQTTEGIVVGKVLPAEQILMAEVGSGMSRARESAVVRDVEVGRVRTVSIEMQLAIARHGDEDGLLDEITDQLMEDSTHKEIAAGLGVSAGEMCRWIFATAERQAAYRGMLRIKADMLVHEGFGVIRAVDTDGDNAGAKVAHAKLETDYMKYAASKWDRPYYGEEKSSVNVGVGVKFVISADDAGVL